MLSSLGGVAEHIALGREGEERAARLLERLGLQVVERNWRCSQGELDLIAVRDDLVVFCEVKTRRSCRWGEPSEAVHPRKQARLRRLAGRWLAEHPASRSRPVRFDVVSVVDRGNGLELTHLPNAF